MECPSPQPGHHLKPMSFKGHSVKCDSAPGLLKASVSMAVTQKASSKYFEKSRLINLVRFVMEQ